MIVSTRSRLHWAVVLLALIVLGACGADDERTPAGGSPSSDEAEQQFPDVVGIEITPLSGRDFDVAVTLSSPYDTPGRYADAWRVLDADGNELGVRELAHDHATEQPFTRQQTVTIPDGIETVTVEGRDLANGYGGKTAAAEVPAAES